MTLGERLGYPPEARLLILHADDAGMCCAANRTTAEALRSGAVSSASAMVPCPWFESFAAECRERPEWDIGVHLTLTSEWKRYRWRPLTLAQGADSLLDDDGFFPHDNRLILLRATPEQVEAECRAQIERAFACGLNPTHLDTHMTTLYHRADLLEIYVRLGIEYGLPVKLPGESAADYFQRRGWRMSPALTELARKRRLPALDHVVMGISAQGFEPRMAEYHTVLRGLKPGVSQWIVHLGDDSAEMRAIFDGWEERWNDFRIVTDPATRDLIRSEGIQFIEWREIQALMETA